MQTGATQLDAALTAALEAAAGRASRRARQIIMAARLATAVHMRRAAEAGPAPESRANEPAVTSTKAALADDAAAARLVREGGRS